MEGKNAYEHLWVTGEGRFPEDFGCQSLVSASCPLQGRMRVELVLENTLTLPYIEEKSLHNTKGLSSR